eukprot:CAMPEP_0198253092 /NCGR_PEP_ID=MMETSP1447-20131203/3547_1 /TAXON_ID=420782 /ORGANISM="Chaetoceros dichaeta, Strain CCMP1751" /LENGTH=181 /DNA_ID=CAMNT_0043938603 /DNA_START=271 /DNA_END=816 /DNA_ORIENTATION=+
MVIEHTPLTNSAKLRSSKHISQQISFYLLYYFTVYAFLLMIQLGMLVITIDTKWILPHTKEPAWIFPIDILLECMLIIEVGVHMFVYVKSKRNWKVFFHTKERAMDFAIACLSFMMIMLDIMKNKEDKDIVNAGEEVAGRIDLLRDIVRVARIFEFMYILNEIINDPDWHSNPSLFMEDVF